MVYKRDTRGERPESKRPITAQKFKKKFLKKKLIEMNFTKKSLKIPKQNKKFLKNNFTKKSLKIPNSPLKKKNFFFLHFFYVPVKKAFDGIDIF